MPTLAKLRMSRPSNVYFLKIHMRIYLRIKSQVSSIILTSLRQGLILPLLPYTTK